MAYIKYFEVYYNLVGITDETLPHSCEVIVKEYDHMTLEELVKEQISMLTGVGEKNI